MYQFTTTTVINSAKDLTTGKSLFVTDADNKKVTIKRHFVFVNDDCHTPEIYYAKPLEAKLDYVDMSDVLEEVNDNPGVYRVAMYINSIGNADPMFANDFVFKGKPLYVEFEHVAGKNVLGEFAKSAKTYLSMVSGGVEVLTLAKDAGEGVPADVEELEGSDLTKDGLEALTALFLVAGNEYQRITRIDLQKESDDATYASMNTYKETWEHAEDVVKGNEGFGTYDHLLKDLRLPTAANLRWKRTMEDEMPVAGATYYQYTIHYSVDRALTGVSAVGQKVTSKTTHVFWVNSAVQSDFETALGALGVDITEATKGETAATTPAEGE